MLKKNKISYPVRSLITTRIYSLYLCHHTAYIIPEIEEELKLISFGPIYILFNDGFGGADYAV